MTDLLDLSNGVGQRASTVRYELVTNDFELIGTVHPRQAPTLNWRVSARIQRTLSGVELAENEARDINPLADRIRPVWILENGLTWNMGVFLWADPERNRGSYQTPLISDMWDQMMILAQPLAFAFSAWRGKDPVIEARRLASKAGIERVDVDEGGLGASLGEPIIYPVGSRREDAMQRLLLMGGYLRPHFDRNGTLIFRPPPALADGPNVRRYGFSKDQRVIQGSAVERDNLTEAPNVFVVENTGATTAPVIGRAYIDPDLPHSRERRGFEVVHYESVQGIESTDRANAMAQALAEVSVADLKEVDFDSPPDPRHDTYDIVMYDGTLYREIAWSMTLTPGATMSHSLNRAGALSGEPDE